MQKLFFLLLLLCFATPAWGETLEFGTTKVRFTVTLPEFWTKTAVSNGIRLASADKTNAISMILTDKNKITLDELQSVVPARIGLLDVRKEKRLNSILFAGKLEECSVQIEFLVFDKHILTIVSAGDARAIMDACIKSLKKVAHEKSAKEKQQEQSAS